MKSMKKAPRNVNHVDVSLWKKLKEEVDGVWSYTNSPAESKDF